MKSLPENLVAYKKTPEFREDTIPAGLLRAHQTRAGTWGLIVILQGELRYRILEPALEVIRLSPQRHGVVEPLVRHLVEPIGAVHFYVEFYH